MDTSTTFSPRPADNADHRMALRLASYCASMVIIGLGAAVLGPTLPQLAANTGVTLAAISILFTARSLGYIAGALRGGRLYDRLPGHPLMAAMLLLMAVMLALMPTARTLWLLAVVVLVMGFSQSLVDVGNNTLLQWGYGARVAPYMNTLHFFFGVGAFVAPVIVAQALGAGAGTTWAYWAMAALAVPAALWVLRQPSPQPQVVTARQQGAVTSKGLVALVMVFFFLYVGAEVTFGGWVFTYAVSLNLTSAASAAYLTAAFCGALTVGRLLSIPLARRFHPALILLVDLLGALASVGLVLLWPGSPAALWLGAAGLGLFMASIFPTLLVWSGQMMPVSGKVTGLFLVGAAVGAMALPWAVGQLIEPAGPAIVMILIAIDLMAALAIWAVLGRQAGRRRQPAQGVPVP